jgi:tetratricopeptide (TPR) repeat protein
MRSLVVSSVFLAVAAQANPTPKPSPFNHSANVKIDVTLSNRVKPPQKADNPEPAKPGLTGDDFLQIEALLSPIKAQQEELLKKLIAQTPDRDTDEKAKYYFMLAELYAKQQRAFRLLATDGRIKAQREPANRAKLEADAAANEQLAKTALANAAKTYQLLVANDDFRNFPMMDVALFYFGYTLQHGGYVNEARAIYDKLLKNYPNSKYVPGAHLAFGDYYFEQSQWADAEDRYKKVLQFPKSSAYWYAMYRVGWIKLQEKQPQAALELFFNVARNTDKEPNLNRAAKKDFVRAYAEVGKADKALPAFQRVDPATPFAMLATLADLYLEQGKNDRAIVVYRELMTRQPRSPDVCNWQHAIAQSMLVIGSPADKIHEIENLVKLYSSVKATLPKAQAGECKEDAAEMSGKLARAYHQEAVKTVNAELLGYADRLYKAYLGAFPEAADHAETQYFRAELAWMRADWEKKSSTLATRLWSDAALAFTEVVETKKLSPVLVKTSADAAMQAWMKALAVDPTVHQAPVEDPAYTKSPTPKPIPELEQKLIAAYDVYLKYVTDPKDDEVVAVKFLKAEAYRKHDHLTEAIDMFADILDHHRAHETAAFAAQLILDSYNRLQREDDMFAWVDKLSADKQFLADNEPVKHTIDRLLKQRLRRKALAFETQAKAKHDLALFVACGDAFLDVYNNEVKVEPNLHDGDVLLYNAGVCYEEGKSLGAAMLVYQMLEKLYPVSTHTAHAIVRLGNVYATTAFYREASQKYEDYAKKYAGEDDAYAALDHAVTFRKGVGDDQRAIDDTNLFIAKFGAKRPAMAAAAFYSLNAIYDKLGDPDKIVEHLRAYIARYGDKGGADKVVIAYSKIGQALWQKSCPVKAVDGSCVRVVRQQAIARRAKTKAPLACSDETKIKVTVVPRDERTVREAMAALDKSIGELDRRGGKLDGDQRGAQYYYAMAKLVKAEREYEKYLAIEMPTGLDFDKNKPAIAAASKKRFEGWFAHKRELGGAAHKQYEAIIALNDGATAIASAARNGQIAQNFSGQLFRAEIPAAVRTGPFAEEATTEYCDVLTKVAEPLEAEALNDYQGCLATSQKLGWFSDYSRLCERELGQLRPDQFPTATELRPEPAEMAQISEVEPALKEPSN